MANIGYCTNRNLSSQHIAKVVVPEGGLVAGNIVELSSLATTIGANYEVFVATQPATANLGNTDFAMVVNGGAFETLPDGRRPEGQPDFTQYTYQAGDIAPVVYLDRHLMFEIAITQVTGGTTATPSSDIGKYIIPANGTNVGAVSATNDSVGNSLKIIGVKYFPLGGAFGGVLSSGFAPTYICQGV